MERSERWKILLDRLYEKRKILMGIELGIFILAFVLISALERETIVKHGIEGELTCVAGSFEADGSVLAESGTTPAGRVVDATFFGMPTGNYRYTIEYETDTDLNTVYITTSNYGNYGNTNMDVTDYNNLPTLKAKRHQDVFSVYHRGIRPIYINAGIGFCGEGYLRIYSVTLERIPNYTPFFFLLLLVLLFDYALWESHQAWEDRTRMQKRLAFTGILSATIAASIPLMNDFLIGTGDLYFHLNRIEGIAEGLRAGQFPVIIQPNWWDDYGYSVSMFYPDFFLYFPASLVLLGYGLQTAYKCYIVAINLLTAGIAYYSFSRILRNRYAGIFGSFIFTTAIYRMETVYSRAAVGEFTGLAFTPLIYLGLYLLFFERNEYADHKYLTRLTTNKGWMLLTVGLCGLMQCHLLSCLMNGLFIILFCLVFIRHTFQKDIFRDLVRTVVVFLFLNIGTILPLFSMMRGDYKFKTAANFNRNIQESGSYLSQFFGVFINGVRYDHTAFGTTADEIGQALGLALTGCVVLFWMLIYAYGKKNLQETELKKVVRIGIFTSLFTAVSLLLASIFFPYDDLNTIHKIFVTLSHNLQFPWRFLGLASMFASATGAVLVLLLRKKTGKEIAVAVGVGVIVLSTVSMSWHNYMLIDSDTAGTTNEKLFHMQDYDYDYLATYIGNTEYIPEQSDAYDTPRELYIGKDVTVSAYEKEYTNIELSVTNGSEQDSYVDVPMWYYPVYKARDQQTHDPFAVFSGMNGRIRILIPPLYSGNIRLTVCIPVLWRVAEGISLIAIAGFILLIWIANKKHE
ncbi:MAG: hypothetical protein K6A92_08340 [Lachnospiraceae bacterium]|nr:hypothetical protein [Lachnospiraceae bacterium]